MLELKNITVSNNKKIILENINLKINKGEIFCIVGESGSGKTSITKLIIGLLSENFKILNGDVFYNGKTILNLSQKEQNKLRGEEIALVFQDAGLSLNPLRKIGEQFIQYIRNHKNITKKEAHSMAKDMIYKMNLKNSEEIMNSYIYQLSGGQRQRVGIAFGLSLNPKLLILDEPTSALDSIIQAQVIDEIIKIRNENETTILMITHNLPLAICIADRIAVMKDGKIIEENIAHEIFKNPKHSYTRELINNIPEFKES